MKNNGILRFLLLNAIFVLLSFNGFGQTTIFTESLGTVGATTTIAAHETANGFDNDTYTMTAGGATNPGDLRATSVSSGYSGASGGANVWFVSTSGQYGFAIEGIDASACTSLTIDFAVRKEGAAGIAFATFALHYWDGSAYQPVTLTGLPTSASAAGWYLISGISLPVGAQINGLRLRFTKSGTIACRLDDIVLKGTCGAPSPTITASPSSLTGFTYVVGSGPSGVQSFTTSGSNLTNDIVLAAPTNFEIATASGGPFSTSLTLTHTSGTVASTPIFTRLVSGLSVNTYTGSIGLTSTGATSLTVALTGTVTPTQPEINIQGNGNSIADGDVTPSSTDLTSFTTVCESSGTITNIYTIQNTGAATLNVTTISFTGAAAADFAVGGISFPATISASSTTTFSVTFDPSASGTRVATLTITNDDSDEGTYDFVIQGTGNVAPTITSQPVSATASPSTSASFSAVTAGSLLSYTWEVNTGFGWNPVSNGGFYSGATTAVLTVTNPDLTMSGYAYRVNAVNACGSVTSNGASTLTVSAGPCLSETFSAASIPAGWVSTSTTFAGVYAEMAANNGELVTIAIANPTSLSFDLTRSANTTAKDLNIQISTTSQTAGFVTVNTFDHSNTTSAGTTPCSVDLSAYTGFATVYIRFQKVSSTTSYWRIDNVNVYCNSTTPSISASPLSLTSFNYIDGFGPSAVQSFTAAGYNLTTDIVLTASTNYQISTSAGGPFSSSISLSPSSGTVASTPIYVQLISGLSVNTYTGSIGLTSTGATSLTVSLSGSVLIATTIFRPGDLVYIGYDCTNGSAEDAIYIMNMVDILPGTSFAHVNSRFETGAAACTRTMHWGGPGDDPDADPAILNIQLKTTASTIPAGSVIRFETTTTGASVISINDGANVVTNFNLSTTGGPPNISGSEPDQLYLVQGTFTGLGTNNVQLNGQVLYGLTNGADWVPFNTAVSNGGTGGATRVSRLHPDLECFNFLNLSQLDIAYYKTTEVHIGSKRTLLGSIGNVVNWTTSTVAASIPAAVSSTTFTITGGNLPGYWVGDAPTNKTDWFTCGNWEGLVVPDNLLDVVIPTSASTFSRIDVDGYALTGCAGSFTSDKYLVGGVRMAVCKTLTIDGKALEFGNGATNSGDIADRLDIFGDLTINNTVDGSIDMDAGTSVQDGTINLQGNWTNNFSEAAFVQGNGTINFVQSLNQSVNTNSFNEVFANIGVNKTGGAVTLNYTAEVEQIASYTTGLINSTLTNLLIFRDGATAVGASNLSFTNGPVRKIGNDAFTFPIGKTSVYAPAGITAPGVVTDHFTAEYFDVNPHPTYDNTLKDITIDHLSICEHWIINRTNGTSNVSVDLSWDTPRSCGVTTLADLLVARWDGLLWRDHGNGGTTGNTTTGTIVTSGVVTSFSPFTLGSISILNPLPIVVNKFEAVKNGANVDLSWSVSNNNKINYFEIWTSTDGESFELNESVKTSNKFLASKDYFTIDNSPQIGINYYKLKIVDANGAITFSDIRSVNFDLNNSIYIFPNPVELGKDVYVNLQLIDENEIVEVSIIDQIGKAVLNQTYTGQKSIYINTLQLAKGVYFVKVKSKNELVSQRIIVI
ncbi:MAG: choice-of-anchor D domain-containing protein [Bacteroidota bacterium]